MNVPESLSYWPGERSGKQIRLVSGIIFRKTGPIDLVNVLESGSSWSDERSGKRVRPVRRTFRKTGPDRSDT